MIKYFNGYIEVNDPSYLTECHYPFARMLKITACLLRGYAFTEFLVDNRFFSVITALVFFYYVRNH